MSKSYFWKIVCLTMASLTDKFTHSRSKFYLRDFNKGINNPFYSNYQKEITWPNDVQFEKYNFESTIHLTSSTSTWHLIKLNSKHQINHWHKDFITTSRLFYWKIHSNVRKDGNKSVAIWLTRKWRKQGKRFARRKRELVCPTFRFFLFWRPLELNCVS